MRYMYRLVPSRVLTFALGLGGVFNAAPAIPWDGIKFAFAGTEQLRHRAGGLGCMVSDCIGSTHGSTSARLRGCTCETEELE